VLARRRAVRFGDTLDYDYVKFEASSQFSLWLSRQASRLNMVVKGRIQVRGFDALCRMAAAGLGIGIVPRRPAEDFSKSMRIAIIELREPWVRRRFNVVYRNRDELASVERTFLSFIEDDWLRHQRPNNLKRGKRSKETKATGKREGYV
jgi:DNA-binding transcriptional LysR family regulator